MKAFSIFTHAFKQSGRFVKLMTWVWLGTMITALPGCWSAYSALKSAVGQTAVPGEWLKGFDLVYLNDVFIPQSALPQSFSSTAVALIMLGMVLYLVMTGGVVGCLRENLSEITFREFLGFGGKYIAPFFGIFVLTAVLTLIALALSMIPYAGIPLAVLLAALWIMSGDVAKVRLAHGEHSVFMTYFSSVRWVVKNFHRLIVLYALNLVVLGIGFAVYYFMDAAITPHGWFLVFVAFLIQQGFVFVRAIVKVNVLACVQHAWDEWKPAPAVIPELAQMPLDVPPASEGLAPVQ